MRYVWAVLFLITTAAAAQQAGEIWGSIYTALAPSISDKQQTTWRGNVNGKLVTDISLGPCSNSLDFSDSCNSQYLPALGAL